MSTSNKFISIDDEYNKMNNAILLNDLNSFSEKDSETIVNSLKTIYEGETLSPVGRCMCGTLKGNFRINKENCRVCHTPVTKDWERFTPVLWAKGLDGLKFMSPKFWILVHKELGSMNFDPFLFLSDNTYVCKRKLPPYLEKWMKTEGFERTYNFFMTNLENFLMHLTQVLPKKQRPTFDMILTIYRNEKDILFSDHIPMIGKRLYNTQVYKNTDVEDYGVADILEVTLKFLNVKDGSDFREKTRIMQQMSFTNAMSGINYYRTTLAGRHGGSRDKIHVTTMPFTVRLVGSSLPFQHKIDEVELPWCGAMTILRPHIINKLVNKNDYSLKNARILIRNHYDHYSEIIDKIFKELIKESDGGLLALLVRNPTLEQSSVLPIKFVKIKTDVSDRTAGMSVLLMSFLAGDFDGDEYNFALAVDKFIGGGFKPLELSASTLSYEKYGEITDKVTITKSTTGVFANAIICCDKEEVSINNIFKEEKDE